MDKNQKIYDFCVFIAKRFYRMNKSLCLANDFDLDDLIQETRLYAWKVLEKYPNVTDLEKEKLAYHAAKWRLNALKYIVWKVVPNLLCKCEVPYFDLENIGEDINTESDVLICIKCCRPIFAISKKEKNNEQQIKELTDDNIVNEKETDDAEFLDKIYVEELDDSKHDLDYLLEIIRKLLPPKHYIIFYEKFIEMKSQTQIGKELNVSKQYIGQIYRKIEKELKEFFYKQNKDKWLEERVKDYEKEV
jgi:RNA polymerase sigma factor (sigma-70 family)